MWGAEDWWLDDDKQRWLYDAITAPEKCPLVTIRH